MKSGAKRVAEQKSDWPHSIVTVVKSFINTLIRVKVARYWKKNTGLSNLCLLLSFHFSSGETSARAAWKQDLPSGWAGAVHNCFSSTDHSMGHLIQCPSGEDVHENSAYLPFSCLSAPSIASKRIFSVYSVMFFIMKLMYCLLFLFLYSKCWIIGHVSVWPGSDVISLTAIFLLYSISGTSLFQKSTFLLWKNIHCVTVFHSIYVWCLLQMIVCCIHKNKVF